MQADLETALDEPVAKAVVDCVPANVTFPLITSGLVWVAAVLVVFSSVVPADIVIVPVPYRPEPLARKVPA